MKKNNYHFELNSLLEGYKFAKKLKSKKHEDFNGVHVICNAFYASDRVAMIKVNTEGNMPDIFIPNQVIENMKKLKWTGTIQFDIISHDNITFFCLDNREVISTYPREVDTPDFLEKIKTINNIDIYDFNLNYYEKWEIRQTLKGYANKDIVIIHYEDFKLATKVGYIRKMLSVTYDDSVVIYGYKEICCDNCTDVININDSYVASIGMPDKTFKGVTVHLKDF